MHIMIRIWLSLLVLSAAAPLSAQKVSGDGIDADTILALKGLQLLDQRMNAIGYRLTTANAAFCDPKAASSGLLLNDVAQYADQETARFALGFDAPIGITAVAPDSPAEAAKLSPGNSLLAINNIAIEDIATDEPESEDQPPAYRRIDTINRTLQQQLAAGTVQLTIAEGGISKTVPVEAVQTCPGQFQVRVSADRSATADGKLVSVSSRLAEYFLSDDEFAAVVAHELAHNLLKHRDRLDAQNVNRGFFGQLGKSAGRIRETEIEADRLSVWLMANAGYDPQAAIRFWTRYGKEHGKGIFSASTHYRWKKRVQLFEEEIAKMAAMKPVEGKYAPPLLTGTD
ncbi:M48 family metallopeptidase [Sphingorhabdus sp. SMR4y]|uniref:M48 family metallopeptidase n=1 Tax=Sphingorhabdus sp. SMR4y TaxID=2584094 RepID=UPI000B5C220F|nr:M48 family metallopeptidase [Sphingorhabdus sp. SMR4y]ASK88761.1 beta-barrel assembly-enhancing protease [Sphingorhabdus sp. SMR4y]